MWIEERVDSLYYIGLWESVRPPVLSWFFHWDYTVEIVLLIVRLPVSGGLTDDITVDLDSYCSYSLILVCLLIVQDLFPIIVFASSTLVPLLFLFTRYADTWSEAEAAARGLGLAIKHGLPSAV